MLRHYGTPMPIDLLAGGSTPSATLTPGTSTQPVTFSPASLNRQVKGDNWPLVRGIVIKGSTTFDQAASGGNVINWDDTFRMWDSFNTVVPKLGTLHDKAVFTGPVAKHVVEFRANGGRYSDWARTQLVAADGDVALVSYVYLPFTNENFQQPEAFWPWTGWLENLQLTATLAASTALAAVSPGAVIKTGCTVSASLDAYVLPQPVRFLISQWNRYQTVAASNNSTLLMQSVGQPNGLSAAVPGCRLAEILELCSPLGLGGATTGDKFTSFQSNELGQDNTIAVDNFMLAYRSTLQRGTVNGVGSAPSHDGAGNPNTMAATFGATGPDVGMLNVSTLYVPWRFSSRNQRLENCLKWPSGNITLTRGFSTVPTTGMHTVVTNEIRELDGNKWAELAKDAGLSNAPVSMLTDRPLRKGQQSTQAGVFHTRKP